MNDACVQSLCIGALGFGMVWWWLRMAAARSAWNRRRWSGTTWEDIDRMLNDE